MEDNQEYTLKDAAKNLNDLESRMNKDKEFTRDIIYFIIFKDRNSIDRLSCRKINPGTGNLDVPISIKYINRNDLPTDDLNWKCIRDRISKMDSEKQNAIFTCIQVDENIFSPVILSILNIRD